MKNRDALSQAFKQETTQSRQIELHELDAIINKTSNCPILNSNTKLLPEVVLTPSQSFINEGAGKNAIFEGERFKRMSNLFNALRAVPHPGTISCICLNNTSDSRGVVSGHYYLLSISLDHGGNITGINVTDSLHQEKTISDYPELFEDNGLFSLMDIDPNGLATTSKLILQEKGLVDCSLVALGNFLVSSLSHNSQIFEQNAPRGIPTPSGQGQMILNSNALTAFRNPVTFNAMDYLIILRNEFINRPAEMFITPKTYSPDIVDISNEIIMNALNKGVPFNVEKIQEFLYSNKEHLEDAKMELIQSLKTTPHMNPHHHDHGPHAEEKTPEGGRHHRPSSR